MLNPSKIQLSIWFQDFDTMSTTFQSGNFCHLYKLTGAQIGQINMEKIRFIGSIKSLDPNRLVGNREEGYENFFLTLGLIFNDLKDISLFGKLLNERYQPSAPMVVGAHEAEFNGVNVHLNRLLSGVLRECLILIRDSDRIFKTELFKLVLEELPDDVLLVWNEIVSIASGEDIPDELLELRSVLKEVRHGVTYHYDAKKIREGFIQRFVRTDSTSTNENALYSLGDQVEDTRFYFADAAAEDYVFNQSLGTSETDLEVRVTEFREHSKVVRHLLTNVNLVIYRLMKVYVKKLPHLNSR